MHPFVPVTALFHGRTVNVSTIAIEAKSGGIFTENWCRGLRAAAELKGLKRRLIVYPHGPVLRT
jgi:hypothetical protein